MHDITIGLEGRELLSLKTTVSSKMQITIPMELAKLFDIRVGDIVRFTKHEATASAHKLLVELVRGGRRVQTFRIYTQRARSFRPLGLVA
jgi:AbrB family looped-hinge helix DNA binding protein